MYPVLFTFGDRPLVTWTVFALMGAWAAFFSFRHDLKKIGISDAQVIACYLGGALAWFVGAYVGHTLTVGRSVDGVFRMSGFVLYGGVLSTVLFGLIFWIVSGWRRRMLRDEIFDAGSIALAWALMFGRIGCAVYGCCYGTPSHGFPGFVLNHEHWDFQNRAFPEALRGVPLHPAPLYEAFGLMLILYGLHRMRRQPERFHPSLPAWFVWISYGVLRFSLEFIRLDPRGEPFLSLTPSQWTAVVTVGIGLALLPWNLRTKRVPIYLAGSRPKGGSARAGGKA